MEMGHHIMANGRKENLMDQESLHIQSNKFITKVCGNKDYIMVMGSYQC
jgi:hypothetical protein